MSDLRVELARHLWDRGFGRDEAVEEPTFEAYLAGIPQIPASLLAQDAELPLLSLADDPDLPLLSLADPQPGLLRACLFLGIQHKELGYSEGDGVPFDERFALPAVVPFWFRHDYGRANRNRRPDDCRDESTDNIQVGSAIEGVFAFVHHQEIVVENEHTIDLPGTVHRSERVNCASLKMGLSQARLHLSRDSGAALPFCGALRVRRK